MPVRIINSGNGIILEIDGHLISGHHELDEFETTLRRISTAAMGSLTLDLLKCNYIDTKLLSTLLAVFQSLKKRGVTMAIINADDDIYNFFNSIQLTKIIDICPVLVHQ